MNAIDLLKEFLGDGCFHSKVQWLNGDDMNVYVRVSIRGRYPGSPPYRALDIATVSVYDKGQGKFTRFLEEAERINPYPILYIENVLERRFQHFFENRGYTRKEIGEGPPCYYKFKVIE